MSDRSIRRAAWTPTGGSVVAGAAGMNNQRIPISSVNDLRANARKHLDDGAVTANYGGDAATAIELLNQALATELTCVLRYRYHWVAARGLDSEAVKAEFLQHAQEELAHADRIAERINQLGGHPNLDPASLAKRSATEYREGKDLVDMIQEDLVAERIAVEHYRELVRYSATRTRRRAACWRRSSPRKRSTPTTCTTCSWPTKASRP